VTKIASIRAREILDSRGNPTVEVDQIGTVSETLEAMATARAANYTLVISHRSGETPDDFSAYKQAGGFRSA